jgi:trehalose 6-phosphate phosphatase
MKYLFDPDGLDALHRFLRGRPLLAFDFDGTLAPLTPSRETVFLRPATRELLRDLSRRFTCAVITGRSLADIAPRVANLGLASLVGNHGLEPIEHAEEFERIVRSWLPVLEPGIAAVAGADLENKKLSVSVHYWRAPDPEHALREIRRVCHQLGDSVAIVPGHYLVNLIPPGAPMKDGALVRIMSGAGRKTALFVGDDWNDERVFEHADRARVFTIRVGNSAQSRAAYFVRSQDEVDALLAAILGSAPAADDDPFEPGRARSRYA